MLTLYGKGVSGGVAIGTARFLKRQMICAERRVVDDVTDEWHRFEAARQRTVDELERLYEWSRERVGQRDAQIFSVHAMMAEDEDFLTIVRHEIHSKSNAEFAVTQAAEAMAAVFAAMDDAYMRERAGDIRDVAQRMLRHLTFPDDTPRETPTGGRQGSIICADDLSPGETVQLDRREVLAFVTAKGSANSHTAILSRTMNIPAVVALGDDISHIREGALVALDAERGCVYVDPDADVLRRLRLREQQQAHARELLGKYRERESRTLDGHRVEICANIGGMEDLEEVTANGADGIGLFRSEFLYLGRSEPPSEDEQFAVYRKVLESMPDRRVVVRTLDVGADKQVGYLGLPKEENPALGLRAVRISLSRPELFLTQARALLRASPYGRLAVMFPFVTSEREVWELKALWQRAKDELRAGGVLYSDQVEIGIMVETPAAALIGDRLAEMVDFFSIGSNDLTQYTLALDRQNAALEPFCDSRHEAVLRLIRHAVAGARRAGIWVGICGEMGADLTLTEELLRMGIHEFSVAPPMILPLRERVCTTRVGQMTELPTE